MLVLDSSCSLLCPAFHISWLSADLEEFLNLTLQWENVQFCSFLYIFPLDATNVLVCIDKPMWTIMWFSVYDDISLFGFFCTGCWMYLLVPGKSSFWIPKATVPLPLDGSWCYDNRSIKNCLEDCRRGRFLFYITIILFHICKPSRVSLVCVRVLKAEYFFSLKWQKQVYSIRSDI